MTIPPLSRVLKTRGYTITGVVRAVFDTRGGATRYNVELDQAPGVIMTYSPADVLLLAPSPVLCVGDMTDRGEIAALFWDGALFAVVRVEIGYTVVALNELHPLEEE